MLANLPFVALLLATYALHSALCGYAVFHTLLPPNDGPFSRLNGYLKCCVAINLGIVISAVCLFVLAEFGLFTKLAVAITGLAIASASTLALWHRVGSATLLKPTAITATDVIIVVGTFLLVIIHAMQAPGYWDDTMYHLPLAKSYITHEGLVLSEFVRFPLVPQYMNLIVALGLMFGGDFGAQAFATLPIFVMAVGLVGAFIWAQAPVLLGAISIVVLVAMTPVRHTLGYAYIDNGMASMCWAATICIAFWSTTENKRSALAWLIMAGLLAGGAAGTKYFGAAFAVLLASYLVVAYRDLKSAVIFGLVMTAICAGWYIRSYLIAGDPVHPVGGPFFGYYLWNAEDFLLQKREQHNFGVAASTLNLPGALKEAGAMLLIPALGCILLASPRRGFNAFRYIFFAYLVFWFVTSQVDRYLAPIFAVGAFLSVLTLYMALRFVVVWTNSLPIIQTFGDRLAGGSIAKLAIAGILGFLCVEQFLKSHPTTSLWQAALEDRAGYRLMSAANDRIAQDGDRLVQIGFENAIYFFDGTAMGDHFGKARYRDFLSCSAAGCILLPPEALALKIDELGAQMAVVSNSAVSGFDATTYAEFFDPVYVDSEGTLLVRTGVAPDL